MKNVYFISIILVLISCTTFNDLIVNSLNDDSLKKINDIDILMLQFRKSGDKNILKTAFEKVKTLEKEAKKNKYYEAKIYGLYGELYFLQNNIKMASSSLNEIKKRNENDERYFLVKALLEKDMNKKIDILNEGITKTIDSFLIKLYLAEVYFLKGKFAEGTGMYDEALIKLSSEFKDFYKKRRDISYLAIKNPPKNADSLSIMLQDEITVTDLVKIAAAEFPSFKKIVENPNLEIAQIYEKLKTDGFFYNEKDFEIKSEEIIKRKDVAFFLLKTISKLDSDPKLIEKYKSYSKGGKTSPVKDILTTDYFFTAVLILVEREIMELPDGINFYPEKTISGTDIFETIKKLLRFY